MADLEPVNLQELNELLKANQKITAIQRYREWTEAGLAEAKEAVELIEAASSMIPDDDTDENWEDEVIQLIRQHKKIKAVKLYRKNTGKSLKDSHTAVLELGKKQGIDLPEGVGCFSVILLMVSLSTFSYFIC